MPVSEDIPTVSFLAAVKTVTACLAADIPTMLIGDPGIGKSALVEQVARTLNLPVRTLLGSTVDPTDIGGIPFRDGDQVVRLPLKIIRDACEQPVVLFLDEISCAPPSVQASLLRVILERVAGDVKLHPGTRVLAACNPPEQAPSGFDLSAPLIGRMVLLRLRPLEEEVISFFSTLGGENSTLQQVAQEFAAIASTDHKLLQIDIPKDAIAGSAPWGSPRSWERAVRARASGMDQGITDNSDESRALITGSVGRMAGHAYMGYMRLKDKLPTIAEIIKDPENALMPTEVKEQTAVLGHIVSVAQRDYWAAWIYACRLSRKELKAAAARILRAKVQPPTTGARAAAGIKARTTLLKEIPQISLR